MGHELMRMAYQSLGDKMDTQALRDSLTLLRTIIDARKPDLLSLVDSLGQKPLTQEQREAMRHVVADELFDIGLSTDQSPNQYGLLLERLIDLLGHY
jgi:hypothetical protein